MTQTTDDLAREICAKLIPHTTSSYNVQVVADALSEVRRDALREAFIVFRTSSSYTQAFAVIQKLMERP